MALVIFNGIQYDDERLPVHVNPKDVVPIEKWRTMNRRVKTRPQMKAENAEKAPADPRTPAATSAKRPRGKKS